jgi:HD-GYP domain-containing protein (c-di-GMP phosphodiesterase class II)
MLQAVVKALPLLLLEIDDDGLILDYRTEDPSVFRVHPDTFLNRNFQEVLPLKVANELLNALNEIKRGNQSVLIQYSLSMEDGEHWFEARFIPSNAHTSTLIIQDVTTYRKNEIKIQRQLDQMSALRAIDRAIASSVDINLTLSVLLTQVINHLQIDAASILLWDKSTERLEYVTGLGFNSDTLSHTKLKLGEGYAGIAALEQQVVYVDNLSNRKTDFLRSASFLDEGFISYYGIPLIAKGEVHGVLEIFKRSPIDPTPEWLNFLEMLGGQAAIAVDNAMLFNSLQRTNAELTFAYQATIEGWSQALDLRDHETEGHTRRVKELTIQLSRLIGVDEMDLPHIQRGAILHDIGKMAIPDSILHKPGPLDEQEWEVMRRHPKYADDLLSQIEYLTPARDIPLYHHEKWDGTGYPFGLKGEDIPRAARIFALVDVFDALTSDRPYRSAWSRQDALGYIQEQAGRHFDPTMTPVFLQMMRTEYKH